MFQSKAPAVPLQSSLPSGQASDGEPTSPVRSSFFFPTSPNPTGHGFWKRSSQKGLTRSPQAPSPPYDDKNQTSRPSSPYRPVSPPPNTSLTIRNDTSPALSKRLPILQQPSKSSATTMAVHGFSTPSFTKSASFSVIETKTIQKDYDPLTGHKVINEYIILRELGRGVHGKVKLAQDSETGELVAIKIVDKHSRRRQLGLSRQVSNEAKTGGGGYGAAGVVNNIVATSSESKIRREIAILKKCVHRHVVRLKKVMDDENSKKIYMVLEYMEGGEIRWKDANDNPILSIEDARKIFRDVVCGLEYLHYQGIIHRDIKPANLLLTGDGVVKISDFGVSYFNEHLAGSADSGDTQHPSLHRNPSENRIDRELAKTAGSPAFFAPELCYAGDLTVELKHSNSSQGSSSNITGGSASRKSSKSSLNILDGAPQPTKRPRITKAIDIWAMGVTLYCFIFGRTPFIADTEFELFKLIPTKPVEFPWEIPDDLKDLILRLLDKDVETRITLEQVKRHPWTIADLPDYQKWIDETDPRKFKTVEITEEDMKSAVTMLDRLKKNLKKISEGLSHLTTGLIANRRRSKSISTTPTSRGFDKNLSQQSSKMLTPSALTQSALRRSQSQLPPLVLPTALPASGSLQNLVSSSPSATSQAISIARSPRGAGAHERFSKLSVYSSSLPERGKMMYFQPPAIRTSRALSVSEEEGTEDDDDAQHDLVADAALYGSSLGSGFAVGRNLNRSPHLANAENESATIVTPLPKTSTNAGVSLRPKWLVGTDSYLSDDGPDEQQSAPASDHSSCQTGSSRGSEINLTSGKVENTKKVSTDRNTSVESENDEDYAGNKSYRR